LSRTDKKKNLNNVSITKDVPLYKRYARAMMRLIQYENQKRGCIYAWTTQTMTPLPLDKSAHKKIPWISVEAQAKYLNYLLPG